MFFLDFYKKRLYIFSDEISFLSLEKGKRVAAAGIFLFITPIPRTTQGRMRFPIKRLLLISIETIDHFTIEKPYLPTPAVTSFHPPLLGRGALIIPSLGGEL
jgi:hypothetical protein